MNKIKNRKGFTTVELVIVIAVIAILATALIPTFGGLIDKANETKDMNAARQAFNDYMLEHTETAVDATYYIHSGNHYYKVSEGKFEVTAIDELPTDCWPVLEGKTMGAARHSWKDSTSDTSKQECETCKATQAKPTT